MTVDTVKQHPARRALSRFPGVLAMAALGTGIVIHAALSRGARGLEQLAQWRLLLVAVLGISWLCSRRASLRSASSSNFDPRSLAFR